MLESIDLFDEMQCLKHDLKLKHVPEEMFFFDGQCQMFIYTHQGMIFFTMIRNAALIFFLRFSV